MVQKNRRLGNAPQTDGEADNTGFNHQAVLKAAGRTKEAQRMSGDFSIPGKKRSGYKKSGD